MPTLRHPLDSNRVTGVAISAEYVAAGYRDGMLVLWQRGTWKQIAASPGRQNHLRALAFSPDGSLLAAGGDGDVVVVWEAARLVETSGEAVLPLHIFRGHTTRIQAVAFAPDGHTLAASASGDGTVKFWDLRTAKASHPYGDVELFNVPSLAEIDAREKIKRQQPARAQVDE